MGNKLQGLRFKEMRPFRRDMQIVFQDPYGSLSPRLSVAEIIKEGLKVHPPADDETANATSACPGARRCRARSGHALSLSA
jgi:ABC-type microcin C transport system duplicated ATPase subunit YejF